MYEPLIFPVALTIPLVIKFPPLTLPLTDTELNTPTEVMLGCAVVVTVPAVVALVAEPALVA